MKNAPGLIAAKNFSSARFRVSGFNATWIVTTSAAAATASGESLRSTPSERAASGVRLRLQATTDMPKARARGIISLPMPPTPTRPSVRPKSPRALLYSFLFQAPRWRSAAFSTIRRSSARRSPQASSATAIEFLPGQLAT